MSQERPYNKEYLPGYTGFVPRKNEVYGCTAGDINRIVTNTGYKPSNFDVDVTQGKPQYATRNLYSNPPEQDEVNKELQYNNSSKHGENWLGGPTQNIKAQHIPGYAGYIPKINSENLYGKSFAKETGVSINGEHVSGFVPPLNDKYQTTSAQEHGRDQFRYLKDQQCPAEIKDQVDASEFHDAEFQGIEVKEKGAWMDLPTVGYAGHQSLFKGPVTNIQHRKDPFFNVNPLRPRLSVKDARQGDDFKNMSAGYQIAMNSSTARVEQQLPDKSEVKIPVVGYGGHRMGYKSQNFYGKNFRDCSIQSKMVQRMVE